MRRVSTCEPVTAAFSADGSGDGCGLGGEGDFAAFAQGLQGVDHGGRQGGQSLHGGDGLGLVVEQGDVEAVVAVEAVELGDGVRDAEGVGGGGWRRGEHAVERGGVADQDAERAGGERGGQGDGLAHGARPACQGGWWFRP